MKRLREWRTSNLMSVRDVAAAAAITPETLIEIEYGRRIPNYGTMRRICQVLTIEPHEVSEFVTAMEKRAKIHKASTTND
jgi:transcriptional regulator with XRE-family HTH domain